MPRRSAHGLRGRTALLHALAHIELNAIDLAFDLIARADHPEQIEAPLPRAFFDDWIQVGTDEARHFTMLATRLEALDSSYGALDAHDGLWESAHATRHDLRARLSVVPLVLEARGLDVTPATVGKLTQAGDHDSAALLEVIYRDEITHVAAGMRWFTYLCDRHGERPEDAFPKLVRRYHKGTLKPPFNEKARAEAGMSRDFFDSHASVSS